MGLYDHIYPTEAEKKLIDAAARGEVCFYSDSEDWNDRTIRSVVIVALSTSARAEWVVTAKGIEIDGAKITGSLDFEETTLTCSLYLRECIFDSSVVFRRARTHTIVMISCRFRPAGGPAIAGDSLRCDGKLNLSNSAFKGEVRLINADIRGDLLFDGATFESSAPGKKNQVNADGMQVSGTFFWRDVTIFNGIISLSYGKVRQLVDNLDYLKGEVTLHLDGFEYDAIAGNAPTDWEARSEWLRKVPSDRYRPQPYEQLVKVLRQMGHEHDARAIAIAKQDVYRERVKLSWLHEQWLRVFKATVSYGYEPWKALYWIAGWIIVGMIAFFLAFEMGAMHPSKERVFMSECYATADFEAARRLGKCEGWEKVERSGINKPLYLPADYPKFQSFVYAVDVFLPFVDLHQESYWLPSDKRWGLLALIYFWAHIAVGWFLATMFIVGFTNIVKKD